MKRFILFFTTLILLPIALQAQATGPIDDSGIVYDSIKVENGILKRYGKLNGDPFVEIVEPRGYHNQSDEEIILEIKSQKPKLSETFDGSDIIYDSIKFDDGILKRYGKLKGERFIEIVCPSHYR
jgi:hypothetical protein